MPSYFVHTFYRNQKLRQMSQELGVVTVTYYEKDKSSKLHPTLFLYEKFE